MTEENEKIIQCSFETFLKGLHAIHLKRQLDSQGREIMATVAAYSSSS